MTHRAIIHCECGHSAYSEDVFLVTKRDGKRITEYTCRLCCDPIQVAREDKKNKRILEQIEEIKKENTKEDLRSRKMILFFKTVFFLFILVVNFSVLLRGISTGTAWYNTLLISIGTVAGMNLLFGTLKEICELRRKK